MNKTTVIIIMSVKLKLANKVAFSLLNLSCIIPVTPNWQTGPVLGGDPILIPIKNHTF